MMIVEKLCGNFLIYLDSDSYFRELYVDGVEGFEPPNTSTKN